MAVASSYAPDASFNALLAQNDNGDTPPKKSENKPMGTGEYRENIDKIGDQFNKLETKRDGVSIPKPPELEKAPKPEDYATSPMEKFGSAGMALAALGSLFTRHHLTNALNSGAAVNNAINEGDASRFKSAYDDWKVNNENAWKMVDFQQTLYNDAMESIDKGESGALAKMKLLSASLQDPTMDNAIRTETYKDLVQARQAKAMALKESMEDAQNQNNMVLANIDDWKSKNKKPDGTEYTDAEIPKQVLAQAHLLAQSQVKQAKQGKYGASTGSSLDNETLDRMAQQYVAGDKSIMTGLGYGSAGAANRMALQERVTKVMKENGATPHDIMVATADLKANTSSLNNLQKMTDSATSFEETASKNFDLALKLAPKGVPTDMGPWINKWIQDGQTATGNKDVPPYVAALLTGANEYAKIMSGSTGAQGSTVDSRREAASLFSSALNIDQIKNVVDIAKKDMDNRKASLNEQLSQIRDRISNSNKSSDNESTGAAADEKPPVPDARKAPDGNWYVPDPNRQGKYLKVE